MKYFHVVVWFWMYNIFKNAHYLSWILFMGIKIMYYSIKKQYRAFYTVNNSVR